MRYTVWIVTPKGYPHSAGFNTTAMAIASTIRDMGYPCDIVTSVDECSGRTIILGGHLIKPNDNIPDSSIIYNLEQLPNNASDYYIRLMKINETWDYSKHNIEWLWNCGIKAKYVPVGYHVVLENALPENSVKDIDVLFYGCVNERRKSALKDVKATAVFGVYGEPLNELIARSKIVLNIHYYQNKIFEITRCGHLFANKVCVVSEESLEGDYPTGGFCEYGRLKEWCYAMLANDELCRRVAMAGYEEFKKRPQQVPL